MSLIHLIYTSVGARDLGTRERGELVDRARANNAKLDITGMLVHVEHCFFQVLEGETEAIDETFLRIAGDPRHARVIEIVREPIARRDFEALALGYAEIGRAALGLHGSRERGPAAHDWLCAVDGARACALLLRVADAAQPPGPVLAAGAKAARMPCRMRHGGGGHPGTVTSTGSTADTGPTLA
jgi:hypothetical protein